MDALIEKSTKGTTRKNRRVIGESQPALSQPAKSQPAKTEKKSRRVIEESQPTEVEDDIETLESGDNEEAYEEPTLS